MRAPLSIIIPTLNSPDMGPTLASVFEAVETGLLTELIFADGGSGPEIAALAQELGAELILADPGRGGQLRAAATKAQGKWFLFLHSDTVLSQGWTDAVREHMATDDAGYFQLQFDAQGMAPKIIAAWANFRSRTFGLPYGDQGLLVPSALYQNVGGYQDIPLMEDVAIARSLRGKLRPIAATATTSAVRYQQQGWIKRGARNLATLMLYFLGASPENLAKRYRSHQKND
jgi:rSAM/selenodomain-associated transferase 2